MGRENSEAELDSYIDDLAGIEKDDGDTSGVDNDNVDNNSGDDNDTGRTIPKDDSTPADKNAQGQDDDLTLQGTQQPKGKQKDQQQDQNAKKPNQVQLRPLGNGTFADAKGNITDQAGNIIAERGFAARMHQQNQRMKATLDQRTEELRTLATQVGEVKALATSIQSYGLSNDEAAQAMDMAGRMKRGDVLGVAKDVLAMIAAQGYNVTDLLGSEVGDTIELKAIQRMIDDRLAPITRQEQTRVQSENSERIARQNYNNFISTNDYAEVHADDIVTVMKQFDLNPQQAYNRLYAYAAQNNFDFSQPLGPQIDALVASRSRQQPQRQSANQQQQQRKPMPSGAATRVNGEVPATAMASADDDWASIIRGVQATMGNDSRN